MASRNDIIKHIDNCRDILVGKVPNPVSQVDQITIALIYKFMNDMDKEAVEMGGTPSFFTGEFEKYSWDNILDSRNGAQEMLNLYAESMIKIKSNPKVPQLFKSILKDAYLPYNDPRILSLFLKEINNFSYEDSEVLGEAFEYLLSIMGKQGDTGSFRTPRHIIDFIVDIIQPDKNNSILDPACGTAGFLISSFKYIQKRYNNRLNSTEKDILGKNLVGYDIDPTMEKLSKVNLYLHGLLNPQIFQYDTLSDNIYWESKYDIILANPPFMTPKGGIKPHKKFSLQSNRSEVLFCDYINTHLKLNGKAGFIVPEGIIFKSDKAYKQLRKSLIEDGLIAVISLPAGIFNPYSGVKTDILILDKVLHKKTNKILFLQINNDGYTLTTQRKEIPENDLPEGIEIFNLFKNCIEKNDYSDLEKLNNKNILLLDRQTILDNENFDLSVNRYKTEEKRDNILYNIKLKDIVEFQQKSTKKASDGLKYGIFPFYTSSKIQNKFTNIADYNEEYLIFGTGGSATIHIDSHFSCSSDNFILKIIDKNVIAKFIYYYFLNNMYILENGFIGSGLKHLSKHYLENIMLPLPPLEIQEEIIKEIDRYEKIISGCKEVIENWQPKFDIKEEWENVELGNICEIKRGASPRPIENFLDNNSDGINWIKIGDVDENSKYITQTKQKIKSEGIEKSVFVNVGDLILSNSMSFGRPYILKINGCIHDGWLVFQNIKYNVNKEYLYYVLKNEYLFNIFSNKATGGTVNNLNTKLVKEIKIPIPPLEVQEEIVAKIQEEEKCIEQCKKMIEIHEAKIKEVINKIMQ